MQKLFIIGKKRSNWFLCFNGISAFVRYLMPNPSLEKKKAVVLFNTYLDQKSECDSEIFLGGWGYLPDSAGVIV